MALKQQSCCWRVIAAKRCVNNTRGCRWGSCPPTASEYCWRRCFKENWVISSFSTAKPTTLIIHLVDNGDVKADYTVPGWVDRQSALFFPGRFRAWWQTELHKSDVCRRPESECRWCHQSIGITLCNQWLIKCTSVKILWIFPCREYRLCIWLVRQVWFWLVASRKLMNEAWILKFPLSDSRSVAVFRPTCPPYLWWCLYFGDGAALTRGRHFLCHGSLFLSTQHSRKVESAGFNREEEGCNSTALITCYFCK